MAIDFVRYGVFAERLKDLDASVKLLLVPSLVLSAHDDPEQLHCVLAGVEDHRSVARAMVYASLDYDEILRNVRKAAADAAAGDVGVAAMDEEDWFENDGDVDECLLFEKAKEAERVELALTSLQRNVLNGASVCLEYGSGRIWNNAAYLRELRLLLPIAVARCPTFLTSEILVKGLLSAGCGVHLLVSTVANNPSLIQQVSELLVAFVKAEKAQISPATSTSTPGVPSSSRRSKLTSGLEAAVWTLFKLCKISPSFASTCRDVLVDAMVLEEMILLVTLEILHDELEFLSAVLFQKSSQWLLSYLSSSGQKTVFTFPNLAEDDGLSSKIAIRTIDKEWLLLELRKSLLKDARRIKQERGWCVQLQAHMKIYCVLIRTGDMHPLLEEIDFWLKMIVHDKANSPCPSQRLLELGVTFLCVVPVLSRSTMKPLYHGCVGYLLSSAKQKSTEFSPAVELAVWFSVQLLLRHLSSIAEFVRETLGVHVMVPNTLLRDFAESPVVAGITSDPSILANAVVALRPQGALAGNFKQQNRTLMCLEQLLHAGTFSRCGIDISATVMHCVLRAREPVSQKLVHLIRSYVDMPVQQAHAKGPLFKACELYQFLIEAISPALCYLGVPKPSSDVHKSLSHILAPAVLATYFVLCREHLVRSLALVAEDERSWVELISCIPWKQFLAYMENSWANYESLLPQWLGLATALFPEKFVVQNILDQLEVTDTNQETESSVAVADELNASISRLQEASGKALSDPVFILRILQEMIGRASSFTWNLKDVIGNAGYWSSENTLIKELVPVLLDPACSLKVQKMFCKWWCTLPGAAKECLTVTFFKTVRVSVVYSEFLKDQTLLDYNSLVRDPLLFLSVDPRLFNTPLLAPFLDTLMEILAVNRRICESSVLESGKDGGLKREEVAAALVVQDSAVCQVLLERCFQQINGTEAQKTVSRTLSSLFHANGLLLKLLHFQGYDVRLIPVMVELVPCMIQCLEFLEELLLQQQQQKQVFAIHLAANLTSRYPDAAQSLQVAEKVVYHALHISSRVAGCSEFLQQTLHPLSQIAVTFPSLVSELVPLLQRCAKAGASLKRNGPPRDPKLEAAAVTAFRTLVGKKLVAPFIQPGHDLLSDSSSS